MIMGAIFVRSPSARKPGLGIFYCVFVAIRTSLVDDARVVSELIVNAASDWQVIASEW